MKATHCSGPKHRGPRHGTLWGGHHIWQPDAPNVIHLQVPMEIELSSVVVGSRVVKSCVGLLPGQSKLEH